MINSFFNCLRKDVVAQYSNISKMAFEISDEQKDFLKRVEKTCKSIEEYEQTCYINERFNDRLIPEFSKIGMLGCPISKKYGGLGYDILTYLLSLEKIGQVGSSLRTFFSAHTSIGQLVLQGWANEEQKENYLSDTTDGSSIMAFALTEPAAGSDPSSMLTTFTESGDNYILNGKKHWIGNGTFANVMTTYAKNKNDGKISAFIVEKNSPGLETVEIKDKIGLLTVKNAEVNFKNCIVPKKNLLGLQGVGLNIAYSALIDGRLSVAAGAIGVMIDCLEESVSHAKKRIQHGQPLAKKQLIQDHIASMAIAIESARWLVYSAASKRQKLHDYVESLKQGVEIISNHESTLNIDYDGSGKKKKSGTVSKSKEKFASSSDKEISNIKPGNKERWLHLLNRNNREYTALRSEADRMATIAKYVATNLAFDCANRAVQVFGSAAYVKNAAVARHFLDSRATIIYEGANEVLELKLASMVLGSNYQAY